MECVPTFVYINLESTAMKCLSFGLNLVACSEASSTSPVGVSEVILLAIRLWGQFSDPKVYPYSPGQFAMSREEKKGDELV